MLHIHSINLYVQLICKSISTSLATPLRSLVANYQSTKSSLNFKDRAVKVSTQENTRSPSETELDMSDFKRSLTQKVNLFSTGSISTWFSEWKKTYK